MAIFSKTKTNYQSSAKVSDGALILSLPDAVTPVVWRMELDQVKAAALEIVPKDENYVLVLKEDGQSGKAKEIAPFDDKEKALRALMKTAQALEQSQPQATTNSNDTVLTTPGNVQQKKKNSFLGVFIALFILAVLIFGLTQIGPRNVGSNNAVSGSSQQENSALSPSGNEAGVPLSADQFLMGR